MIRLSGPDAMTIADSIFTPAGRPLSEHKGYTIARGTITDDEGNTVDDVLASVFRSPRSYTGEDCIELSCHASPYIVQRVIELLCRAGCRMAEPGEFTRRAFLNGKMDLSRAEAVADLIAASSAAEHRTAMNQMRGVFSEKLAVLREQLLRLTSLMELELDFTDHEDLTFADRAELLQLSSDIARAVCTLARSFKTGDAIRRGVAVAIVGETNTGKSTLLNALSGDERAIVSDVHGTTRDTIEDNVYINGVHFRFIDTAGIRHTDNIIETLGIQRSYKAIAGADIVIMLLDAARLFSTTHHERQPKETDLGAKLPDVAAGGAPGARRNDTDTGAMLPDAATGNTDPSTELPCAATGNTDPGAELSGAAADDTDTGTEFPDAAAGDTDTGTELSDAASGDTDTGTELSGAASDDTGIGADLPDKKDAPTATARHGEKTAYEDLAKRIDGKKVIIALNKCDLLEDGALTSRPIAEADNLSSEPKTPLSAILSASEPTLRDVLSQREPPLSAVLSASEPPPVVLISAKNGTNIDALKNRLVQLAAIPEIAAGDVVVTNARHYQALTAAAEDINRVITALAEDIPTDLVCEDLRLCLHHLAEITGAEITSQETLNNIFARFCVGK